MTPQPRLLFVHIPRTGGSSIRQRLGLESSREIHLTLAELDRRGLLQPFARPFTVVRNPWGRALSIFRFFNRHDPERISPESFRRWIDGGLLHPSGRRPTLYAATSYEIDVTAPQADWLRVGGEIPSALLIDRFDRLSAIPGLPHVNASPAPPGGLHHYFDPETVERLSDLYREDIECFGYHAPPSFPLTGVSA